MTEKDNDDRRPRISAKLKKAMAYHVHHAMTTRQSSEAAGLSFKTWEQAMDRPHVQRYIDEQRRHMLAEVERMEELMPFSVQRRAMDIVNDETAPANVRISAMRLILQPKRPANTKKPSDLPYLGYDYKLPDDLPSN